MFTVLALFSTQLLEAQNRLGFELRGAAAFPTQKLGGADLNAGFGFEGIFNYDIVSNVGIFAGWGYNQLSADESFAGPDIDFEETGYVFGLQFNNQIGESTTAIYLRGGGIYNHIEAENRDGDIIGDTGHGLGWRAEIGLDISLSDNFSIKPGVKYQALSRDLTVETTTTAIEYNYLSAGVGLAWKF